MKIFWKTFHEMLESSSTIFHSSVSLSLSLFLLFSFFTKIAHCKLMQIMRNEKVPIIFLNAKSRIIKGMNLFCIAYKHV